MYGTRNTVQQLLRKTLNFISPEAELWPKEALGVYNSMNMSCMQVNKIEEIKQRQSLLDFFNFVD